MADFWEVVGTTLTAFLKGLDSVWEWLTNPLTIAGVKITINDWQVIPIQIFGAGFVVFLVFLFALHIKNLIL